MKTRLPYLLYLLSFYIDIWGPCVLNYWSSRWSFLFAKVMCVHQTLEGHISLPTNGSFMWPAQLSFREVGDGGPMHIGGFVQCPPLGCALNALSLPFLELWILRCLPKSLIRSGPRERCHLSRSPCVGRCPFLHRWLVGNRLSRLRGIFLKHLAHICKRTYTHKGTRT